MRRFLLASMLTLPVFVFTQGPAPQLERAVSEPESAQPLPVRRVILYKTGVGYFEHLGSVRDRQNITIRFTSAQLNDVLSSLTVMDLGKGQVTGISYNSVAPLEQRLGALRLPLGGSGTQADLLRSLRGARVEVNAGAGAVRGRLLSVEQRARQRDGETIALDMISVVTDAGELHSVELSPAVRVRLLDRDLRQEVNRYLDVVGSTREQDVRSMVIATAGAGERPLFVSYVSEVPIWKSTYRLVLPATGKPLLQGWAVVDNTIGEDWRGVELSLVAGAPQSFIQHISQPLYGRRAVVPMPSSMMLAPQTHQASLGDGAGVVRGTVRDRSGAPVQGATVILANATGVAARATSGPDGRYQLNAPAGVYSLRFELPGLSSRVFEEWRVPSGAPVQQDVTMEVGRVSENVTMSAEASSRARRSGGIEAGVPGGTIGGVVGGLPAAPEPPPPPSAPLARDIYGQARDLIPQASAASLGDLFEYRVKEPITLGKNQSALVPIVNAEIEAEKVSLWNRASGSGRPLRAVWLTNATGLTLDGGSMTLIDADAFAGEGLLDALKPGERRLLSYAADLGVLVDARRDPSSGRTFRLRAREGIIIQDTEERVTSSYRARNEHREATTLIIEHRMQPGWKLADGQLPVESTADTQRFRVVLPPGKETVFEAREVRRGESSIMVGDVDGPLIAQLARSGVPAAELERALEPVFQKRSELSELEHRKFLLDNDRNTIVQDQQRLRENMKALRGSAEEKQLLQRYTRQLDQQETRLEKLEAEAARIATDIQRVQGELYRLIASISFDLTVP